MRCPSRKYSHLVAFKLRRSYLTLFVIVSSFKIFVKHKNDHYVTKISKTVKRVCPNFVN